MARKGENFRGSFVCGFRYCSTARASGSKEAYTTVPDPPRNSEIWNSMGAVMLSRWKAHCTSACPPGYTSSSRVPDWYRWLEVTVAMASSAPF